MSAVVIYTYSNCSTCRDATKWLRARGVAFEERPIRETPPSVSELKKMLAFQKGDLKKLFNSSGQDYRDMQLKDKFPTLTEREALALMTSRGNLVKRPFLLAPNFGLVGFKPDVWKQAFAKQTL